MRATAPPRRGRLPFAVGLFVGAQVSALTIALLLHAFAKLEPLRYTLLFSFLYVNANALLLPSAFALARLDPRHPGAGAGGVVSLALTSFAGCSLSLEVVSAIIRRWLKPDYLPVASVWHLELLLAILGLSVAGSLAWTSYLRLRAQLEARELELLRLENEAIRAELAALRARLNPHFLFNSLNVIAALAAKDPRRVEDVTLDLAEIYRLILRADDNRRRTLGEELDLLRRYLAVEAVRLGERLQWRIEAEPGLEGANFPPLLLQPVVENAVLHGVGKVPQGGTVVIQCSRRGADLVLRVEDDGAGVEAAEPEGFGLASVRERLRLSYGERGAVSVTRRPAGGTQVTLLIPLESE